MPGKRDIWLAEGWMHGWVMGGWIDRWVGGWMAAGWMDGYRVPGWVGEVGGQVGVDVWLIGKVTDFKCSVQRSKMKSFCLVAF